MQRNRASTLSLHFTCTTAVTTSPERTFAAQTNYHTFFQSNGYTSVMINSEAEGELVSM